MARVCQYSGKKTSAGRTYTTRGLAKSKGGVGKKITGKTKRLFKANIQRVRAVVDGRVVRVEGRGQAPPPRRHREAREAVLAVADAEAADRAGRSPGAALLHRASGRYVARTMPPAGRRSRPRAPGT